MSERETVVELPFAADRCPCVEKLRTVLSLTVGIRDGAVHSVSTLVHLGPPWSTLVHLGSAVISEAGGVGASGADVCGALSGDYIWKKLWLS
jgi:hypothetical protein